MFENLLAQDEALALLRSDVETGRLPPALLFAGPPGSGKLTAALEMARALSCTAPGERAAWNCPCPSCARHRSLSHSDLVLMGPRTFPEELGAALEMLERSPGKAASYFFVRAARKLLRRFDPVLFEGEEARLGKAIALVREAEENLERLAPERASTGQLAPGAAEAAAKVAGACAKLEGFVPDSLPVFMVRNAELWARLAPLGSRKTVVIENADRMLDSARNALLKILEEPPESVRFVLLSSRRSALLGTILSRSRTYAFRARDAAGTQLVLDRVFRSGEPAASVEAFLAARRAFPPSEARQRAEAFLSAALAARTERSSLPTPLAEMARTAEAERRSPSLALAALMEATKDFGAKDERYASSFRSFLSALAGILGAALRDGEMDARGMETVESWARLLREARADYESWNRNPGLIAETLLYAIAEEP
ncbi:MAG TPA: hypothetical protein VFL04_01240 [Rectinemataceae bacterium]|nr:hypothetical protein [Rectinemataceae bacterium]